MASLRIRDVEPLCESVRRLSAGARAVSLPNSANNTRGAPSVRLTKARLRCGRLASMTTITEDDP
jgi:hypothetical protein